MLTAGGRLREGETIALGRGLALELVGRQDRRWLARPNCADAATDMLERAGYTPLPPYILKARIERGECVDDAEDRLWYRTLFADDAHRGSVAAPTAGLHLTPSVDSALAKRGVDVAHVTLHVGEGTFRGIETDTLEAHAMHSERFSVNSSTVAQLQLQRQGRLIAVGTTTTRLLESLPESLPAEGITGSTDLLIAPGHDWRWVDGLLTNFHLPRSTLLALVGAMVGMDNLRTIYAQALEQRYRFYSYGDAMLILP
jgi:S-adenosylmethionine:tRNA ribosyltransferase-isomerase